MRTVPTIKMLSVSIRIVYGLQFLFGMGDFSCVVFIFKNKYAVNRLPQILIQMYVRLF